MTGRDPLNGRPTNVRIQPSGRTVPLQMWLQLLPKGKLTRLFWRIRQEALKREKSAPSIVAVKSANKSGRPDAESMELRGGAKGNSPRGTCTGHRAGSACPTGLSVYFTG